MRSSSDLVQFILVRCPNIQMNESKIWASYYNYFSWHMVVGMPEDAMQRKTIDRMASFGTF